MIIKYITKSATLHCNVGGNKKLEKLSHFKLIFGHIFQFLYFANLFKIRNLKKLSLLKGDENFFLGKKFGGGS